jgi:ubiquinone/menaquinone biosynthesis C-methylase UbiE
MTTHQDRIEEQFARQAVPFSKASSIADEDAIQLLIDAAKAGPQHRSLDVACGPGLVALAFARVVASALGLDTTAAMLDRARVLQARQSCRNVEWVHGDVYELPFPDHSFDIVTCRFAFHHLLSAANALVEMVRVIRPGGRIVVCDGVASDDPRKAAAFNAFERMRDPSTVRFLTAGELRELFGGAGLSIEREQTYHVPAELEGLLRVSFPKSDDVATLRETMRASIIDDCLGLSARTEGDRIVFGYPSMILSAVKSL